MNHNVAAFTEVGSGTCFIFIICASFGAHNTQTWCFYADNTQLYLPVKATDPGKLSALLDCITAVKNWMTENFLQVNSTKTEVLVIGSQQMAKQILPSAGPLVDCIKPAAKNLGIWFDSNLNFEQHTTKLVQSCFYHLRNISKIRSFFNF